MKEEISSSAGNGTDYELVDGGLSVNSGFTGSITAEYIFTTSPTREIDFDYDLPARVEFIVMGGYKSQGNTMVCARRRRL